MFTVLPEPEVYQAYTFLSQKVYKELIVVFADCEIAYRGRAESKASSSPRLVIIKPDGTIVIHESVKREPINWQPPGTKITIMEDPLKIIAERTRPREVIEVYLHKIYYITSSLVMNGDFIIKGREIDIVEKIMREPEIIERGFKPIQREFKTPYGKIDLLGIDKNERYVIVEVKRSKAQLQAVSQLYRYYLYFRQSGKNNVRGILVAPEITKNAHDLLTKLGLEFIKIESDKGRINLAP
ncbi:DUF91 domain-containing protein [Sulfolobus sp. B1]|uniref:endonuclease NucS n=1 Tax=Sulfolobaceae TaxID=118883 RepID=UPI000845FE2D|nr:MULTISPECIES: endonuclease NucS [unclassified Sulfolobus]TRM76874.1 endonuclease NucS [Sulfolobus sp. A20-N-F8]TRM88162.1 endonuclease NucS [Sulfolobus sp. C3]TRM94893.1 endonuclease NucS [Sulfolobus sp. A20-N-G8]TRN02110.1 endonuclease NucS [Sulfolobus sp. F1]TRN02932.1 endonuclease NucS [Sulfolobus sp. E1]